VLLGVALQEEPAAIAVTELLEKGPYALDVTTDENGAPALTLLLPSVTPREVEDGLIAYATAHRPVRTPVTLPDGDRFTELRAQRPKDGIIEFEAGRLGKVKIEPQAEGTMMTLPPHSPLPPAPSNGSFCPGKGGSALSVRGRALDALLKAMSLESGWIEQVEIKDDGNGGVQICG
jgi:hypothetical protein